MLNYLKEQTFVRNVEQIILGDSTQHLAKGISNWVQRES